MKNNAPLIAKAWEIVCHRDESDDNQRALQGLLVNLNGDIWHATGVALGIGDHKVGEFGVTIASMSALMGKSKFLGMIVQNQPELMWCSKLIPSGQTVQWTPTSGSTELVAMQPPDALYSLITPLDAAVLSRRTSVMDYIMSHPAMDKAFAIKRAEPLIAGSLKMARDYFGSTTKICELEIITRLEQFHKFAHSK